jgi:hypothetical protein
MQPRHRSLSATDDIRAEIEAIRGTRNDLSYRSSRPSVSPSGIRQRTGTALIVALVAIVVLGLIGIFKLAWAVGASILHIAWPSHHMAQTLLDWLPF